jgi:hypothetical protein
VDDLTAALHPQGGILDLPIPLPGEVSEPITSIVQAPGATPARFVSSVTPAGLEQGIRISSTSTIDHEGREVGQEVVMYWSSRVAWPVGEFCDPRLCAPRRRQACARLGLAKVICWRPAVTCPRRASGRRHSSSRRAGLSRRGADPPGPSPNAKSAPLDLRAGIGALSPRSHFEEDLHPPLKTNSRLQTLSRLCLLRLSHRVESVSPGSIGRRLIEASTSGRVSTGEVW